MVPRWLWLVEASQPSDPSAVQHLWSDRMGRMPEALAAAVLVLHCGIEAAHAADPPTNDYPTVARADYVFGCMQVNGQTRDALRAMLVFD